LSQISSGNREIIVVKKYCRNPVPGYTDVEMITQAKDTCPELELALNTSNYCLVFSENTKDLLSSACPEIHHKIRLFEHFFLDPTNTNWLSEFQFQNVRAAFLGMATIVERTHEELYPTQQ
jgi:hypothetical protein